MNRLAFITRIMYRLKRRYGSVVDIVWRTSSTVDRATGEKTVEKSGYRVKRMIVLPSVIHREFSYDLAYIAAAKNFTYGGFFDTRERRFIVDTKDLPADFQIKVGYWFVYDSTRYDVKQVERFEENRAFFITAKQSEAAALENVIELEIVQEISMADATSAAMFGPASYHEIVDELSLTDEAEATL